MKTTYSIAIIRTSSSPRCLFSRIDWMKDENGKSVEYADLDHARDAIKELDAAPYLQLDWEAGRPEYVILDQFSADYVRGNQEGDMSNYNWGNAECTCGECGDCLKMMERQNIAYIFDHAQ